MEILTTTVPELNPQECCIECGMPFVRTINGSLVCENCGIVPETEVFEFRESMSEFRWRQTALERNRYNGKVNYQYRVLNRKLKRHHYNHKMNRAKIFNTEIARLCAQLELPSLILRDAKLYADDILQKLPPYTHLTDVLATATALVWGCSFIYSPRTLAEIMSVASSVVDRKRVLNAANKTVFTHLINKCPRMLRNKQFPSLINYYLDHFGAVLNVSPSEILMAKELFYQLGQKRYTYKTDIQSIALLWCVCMKNPIKMKNVIDYLESFSGYMKGHQLRVKILDALSRDPKLSVQELATRLGRSYHVIYYHLRKLVNFGLLTQKRKKINGRTRKLYYFASQIVNDEKNTHTRLNWQTIKETCFTSIITPRKVVAAIYADMKRLKEQQQGYLYPLTSGFESETVFCA